MTARAVVCGNHRDGWVDLELRPDERCVGCAGVCFWRRFPAVARARLPSAQPLTPGTPVLLVLPERYILLSALLLHGLPWLALLVGAVAGAGLGGNDLGALLGAVLAGVLSIIMTPRLRRRLERATMECFSLLPLE